MQKELKNKNSEQSRIKKIFRFTASRFLFLVIGISLSITFVSVYAAWNTTVSTGTPLTKDLWNDVVDKLIELNTRTGNLEGCGTVCTPTPGGVYGGGTWKPTEKGSTCTFWGNAYDSVAFADDCGFACPAGYSRRKTGDAGITVYYLCIKD